MKPRALVDSLRELAEHTTRTKGVVTEFSTRSVDERDVFTDPRIGRATVVGDD